PLLGGQREVYLIRIVDDIEGRLGDGVDIAELAVQLAQVFKPLAQLGSGEYIAFRHLEQRLHEGIGRAEKFYAGEGNLVEVILPAFLHRNSQIREDLSIVGMEQGNLKFSRRHFADLYIL